MSNTAFSSPGSRSARSPAIRAPHLADLALDALRAYRQELIREEAMISYWRRVVHARIDDQRTGADRDTGERLRSVLAGHQLSRRRGAHPTPYDGNEPPPMPDLAVLWDATPQRRGGPGRDRCSRLATAEAELSAYRHALHERLDEATCELIARYREQPALALKALPGGSDRRGAA